MDYVFDIPTRHGQSLAVFHKDVGAVQNVVPTVHGFFERRVDKKVSDTVTLGKDVRVHEVLRQVKGMRHVLEEQARLRRPGAHKFRPQVTYGFPV